MPGYRDLGRTLHTWRGPVRALVGCFHEQLFVRVAAMAILLALFAILPAAWGEPWIALGLAAGPVGFVALLLLGSRRFEFCERGVRVGVREVEFTGKECVSLLDGLARRGRLTLRIEPEDEAPVVFATIDAMRARALHALAERYSRPIAWRMWRGLRKGREVPWTPSLWLRPDALVHRRPWGAERVVPFAGIGTFEVRSGRYRLWIRDTAEAEIEGDAGEPNFVAGEIVLRKILARQRPSAVGS